jgi:localization factor PodJL
VDNGASFFDPLPLNPPEPVEPPAAPAPASRSTPAPSNDVTGSIAPYAGSPRSTAHGGTAALDALPASIGPVLRMAAAANEPAAEYELGTRYAEGRGVPRDLSEATQWLQRAADAGFAPAQFRLGSLKEKGDGVKKDPEAARRLYLAAARKGHAKAMHNLAVLYAEGINDKPDYTVAAEWFRRAANYGVTDSQYNLAILYARGIGVQADLAEAYRWFALAASKGDADAARKRDQVGAELDQYTLAAAKREVQTFVAKRQPEEATSLRVPPGGWDRTPAPPAKPRR